MEELTSTLAKRLLEFLGKKGYRPLKQHELAGALNIKGSERSHLRRVLRGLVRQGKIAVLRKNRFALPEATKQLTGHLTIHPHGFGFVVPEKREGPDIYIDKESMGIGLHGDKVIVTPTRRSKTRGDRMEGKIVGVVERKTTHMAGLLKRAQNYWYVIPDNPRVFQDIRIVDFDPSIKDPKENQKVVVELEPWEHEGRPLTGIVREDLGPAGQAGVDMLSLMRDYGLVSEFQPKILDEAHATSATVSEKDIVGRKDMRSVLTITIDPEDAKDFDDAISLEKKSDGNWLLGVHIADVAHYVKRGTHVDHEALERGNSVYMVDRFIPMLPKYLTSDVCSLVPHKDRLAHTASLTLDDDGNVLSYETFPSVIHSNARLNYDQVQLFMDKQSNHQIPAEVIPMLTEMYRLGEIIRRRRMENGSIDLAMPEIKCVLDKEGKPIDIFKRGAPEAYHLIEEFMLLANCAVAEFIASKSVPALYRIHEPPSEEQWAKMMNDLLALGIEIEPQSSSDINDIVGEVRGTPLEYSVSLAILKNLKRAMYSPGLDVHFGLAFEKYTHFTSPIRRYPDLVVHRILNALEKHAPPPHTYDEIAYISDHCSDTERQADAAEEESLTIKRIEYFSNKLQAGETGPFEALIVNIVPKGLMIELTETLQRGLVAFATLTDDFYTADVERGRAVGRQRKNVFKMGQLVSVELIRVDRYRRFVDFRLHDMKHKDVLPPRSRRLPKTRGRKKRPR